MLVTDTQSSALIQESSKQESFSDFSQTINALYKQSLTSQEHDECERNLFGFFDALVEIKQSQVDTPNAY